MTEDTHAANATIVVAVDGSPESANALKWASTQADATGCKLRIITYYRHYYVAGESAGVSWEQFESTKLSAEARASEVIEDVLGSSDVDHIIALGPVDRVLIDHGRDASMIVLGTRSSFGLRGAVRSSTTNRVTGKVPCPVVSIPLDAPVLEGAS